MHNELRLTQRSDLPHASQPGANLGSFQFCIQTLESLWLPPPYTGCLSYFVNKWHPAAITLHPAAVMRPLYSLVPPLGCVMVQSLVWLHMVQKPLMCFCIRDSTCVDSSILLPWVALTPGY